MGAAAKLLLFWVLIVETGPVTGGCRLRNSVAAGARAWHPRAHRPRPAMPAERKGGLRMSTTVSGFMLPALTACLRSVTSARLCLRPPRKAAL
jgi:hypothetical protein